MSRKVNTVKQSYGIINKPDWDMVVAHIERCGRLCYKSEDRITATSANGFIANIIKRGHESVLEHFGMTVIFTTDRGISHEIVRHRLASYSQESTRYCNYSQGKFGSSITVIPIDRGIELDQSMSGVTDDQMYDIMYEWHVAMEDAQEHYNKMIELGASPQIARSVLPNSTKTEIAVTANLREWRHILRLRTGKAAHPQIRELMIPLLLQLQGECPAVFNDIEINSEDETIVGLWIEEDEGI